jgi:hypothetical protein
MPLFLCCCCVTAWRCCTQPNKLVFLILGFLLQLEDAALNLGMGCLAVVEKVAERAAASPRCDHRPQKTSSAAAIGHPEQDG